MPQIFLPLLLSITYSSNAEVKYSCGTIILIAVPIMDTAAS